MRSPEEVAGIITSDDSQLTPTTPRERPLTIAPAAPHTPPREATRYTSLVRPVRSATVTPMPSPARAVALKHTEINYEALDTDTRAEFIRLLTCTDAVEIVKNKDRITRAERTGTFTLYTMSNLAELYPDAKLHEENLVRFIVKKNGQLYFAKEGVPSGTNGIPAHHEMDCLDKTAAECITAGNVRLIQTADGRVRINFINHKSGDFRPSFTSLRSLIVILAANPELLADIIITLEYLNESGGELAKVSFTKPEFLDLAARILATGTVPSPETQSVETVTVTRPPLEIRALRTITNTTPVKRKNPGDDTGRKPLDTSPAIRPLLLSFDAEAIRSISPWPAASLLPPAAAAAESQMHITPRRRLFS